MEKTGGRLRLPASHRWWGWAATSRAGPELVYADGLDLSRGEGVTGIGIGCRLCERRIAASRAFPPLQHRLVVDEMVKGPSAYAFRP